MHTGVKPAARAHQIWKIKQLALKETVPLIAAGGKKKMILIILYHSQSQ